MSVVPNNAISTARLRLLQLASPSLPIGAFAYSHGLEQAAAEGILTTPSEVKAWVCGLLEYAWASWDVPLLVALLAAAECGDTERLGDLNTLVLAGRESAELSSEDRHTGAALARLLTDLQPETRELLEAASPCAYATAFAIAGQHWGIPGDDLAGAYLWTLTENQVMAAVRLVPLGQTAGQLILASLAETIPLLVASALETPVEAANTFTPGLAMASARHETQYTRLFRS